MKLRLPSIGFCYVVVVAAACPWFFEYVNRPLFFEQPWESRARDLGEAQYLTSLAGDRTDERRTGWLRRAHELFLRRSELALADRVLAELAADGITAEAVGLRELAPGIAWARGLDADGWTTGRQLATFVLHNPTTEPRQVLLHFSTGGDGRARQLTPTETIWFSLNGPAGQKAGSIKAPLVPPGERVAVSIGAEEPFPSGGQQRGLKFERIELVR